MDNLIVEVKDSEESNQVVQMMMELSKGEGVNLGERLGIVVLVNGKIYKDRVHFKDHYLQTYNAIEVTVTQLRDLVVLKRNDVADATHKTDEGLKLYWHETNGIFYKAYNASSDHAMRWTPSKIAKDEAKPIKEKEMKEFLVFHNDKWTLQLLDADTEENSFHVIVPDEADIYVKFLTKSSCAGAKVFYKTQENGDLAYFKDGTLKGTLWNRNDMLNTEHDSEQSEREILWQREQPEEKQLPVTPIEQGSREHFEQIDEIAERIKSTDALYCRKGNWYICPDDNNREDEAFLDGAWLMYQKLQGL